MILVSFQHLLRYDSTANAGEGARGVDIVPYGLDHSFCPGPVQIEADSFRAQRGKRGSVHDLNGFKTGILGLKCACVISEHVERVGGVCLSRLSQAREEQDVDR